MTQVAVALQDLELLPEPVRIAEITSAAEIDSLEITIPEGTIQSVLVLDHHGELEAATLTSAGHQSQALDDTGNLRAWVLDSVEAEGAATLTVTGSGKSNVFLLEHRQINHRMNIAHKPNFDNFFPNDPVTITHHFSTVTGADISPTLSEKLLAQMILERDGAPLSDLNNDTLPAEPTLAIYTAAFAEAPFVASTGSSIEVLHVDPLTFSGGFSEEKIWAASEAVIDITMARQGGRQQLAAFELPIATTKKRSAFAD